MPRSSALWARIVVHLLPARCFVCDGPLPARQHLGSCVPCWSRLVPAREPSCVRCGLGLAGPSERCARCVIRPLPLDGVRAAFVYDGTARRFLMRAKAGGRRELLVPFSEQVATAVRIGRFDDGAEVVVPVPSSPWARLRRGFDPAAAIGRGLSRALGIPFDAGRLRRRAGAVRASKSLDAAARWRAAHEAFVARGRSPATVLLVDDVMTTGATASACARALRQAGAREVRLAIWARTPKLDHGSA